MSSGYSYFSKKVYPDPPNSLLEAKHIDLSSNPPKQVFYPEDLFAEDQSSYILFQRRDPVARGSEIKAGIALYMPPQIQVNYGAQWEPIQMTALQYYDFGKDVAGGIRKLTKYGISLEGAIEGLKKSFTDGTAGLTVANALDFFASGSTFGQQLLQATGKTVNPHMALLFKGVEFRSFEFTFKMMAKSEAESKAIRDIIKHFKSAMHPAALEGVSRFWVYPDNFDIFLYTRVPAGDAGDAANEYMFQIDTAVLTNMSVNYAGSGIPVFFETTGAPVDIEMTLQFQELGILTREKVEKGY